VLGGCKMGWGDGFTLAPCTRGSRKQ
jgi:hypothetical protein